MIMGLAKSFHDPPRSLIFEVYGQARKKSWFKISFPVNDMVAYFGVMLPFASIFAFFFYIKHASL